MCAVKCVVVLLFFDAQKIDEDQPFINPKSLRSRGFLLHVGVKLEDILDSRQSRDRKKVAAF